MYSLVSHLNIFPIESNVNLSCGGGHLGFLIGIKNLNFVEDLPVINGSLIHKCLTYQQRKQKTTPTNDKMTATVPTFLCIFLLHHLQNSLSDHE
jgi:hypothetical protein